LANHRQSRRLHLSLATLLLRLTFWNRPTGRSGIYSTAVNCEGEAMEIRREKAGNMPPKCQKQTKWQDVLDDVATLPAKECTVVIPTEKLKDADGSNIERLARSRGLRVKACIRGKEIWIERLA
jgi:hypothetical protein